MLYSEYTRCARTIWQSSAVTKVFRGAVAPQPRASDERTADGPQHGDAFAII